MVSIIPSKGMASDEVNEKALRDAVSLKADQYHWLVIQSDNDEGLLRPSQFHGSRRGQRQGFRKCGQLKANLSTK